MGVHAHDDEPSADRRSWTRSWRKIKLVSLRRRLATVAGVIALAAAAVAQAKPALFAPWINGTAPESSMQVQRYDRDTYVIRQSIRTNFEGPFLYLFFGRDRALLLDTGAGGLQIRPTIDGVIARWCTDHHRNAIPLVVAHTHSHGDHHQGDLEFKDRPDTVVVGLAPEAVAAFFHIPHWPNDIAKFDLGGRVLDIVPSPGHQTSHIMVFDEQTRLLQSGDALYPGRLYVPVDQFTTYRDSIDRVVAFTKTRHVSHILGNHIEMTRAPGEDYPMHAPNHPDERALELPYAALLELQAALHAMGDMPVRQIHSQFIIYPEPSR
jgi:glyoxylase-like metal-dependent hydrolase (beta-lactamase superfamily II)